MSKVYKNSTELMQLHGKPIYMADMVDACLLGRLNLFLQGDTGSGKTQLAADAMSDFGHEVGDGKFAKDVQEKYSDRLGNGTNLAIGASGKFPEDNTLFVLGRNDMDVRELFSRINLGRLNQKPSYNLEPLVNSDTGEVEFYYHAFDSGKGIFVPKKLTREQADVVRKGLEKLAGTTEDIKELTSKINTHLVVVDEMPNCVPAVRAQLFNLFDGYIEINGKKYDIGRGYSVGIATGNIGQKFTESSNELGRALKDRMHVTIDTDYYRPTPLDTLEILAGNTCPRVEFAQGENKQDGIIKQAEELKAKGIPFDKLVIANYLLHGLDYCTVGGQEASKTRLKDSWPNKVDNNQQGSDEALVLPVSVRAAKSIIRLSQALDSIAQRKGGVIDPEWGSCDSMTQAYKFVSAYSGVLNEASVQENYNGNRYAAMNAVIEATRGEFERQADYIAAGTQMAKDGKKNAKVLDNFIGRWRFIRDTLEGLVGGK